MDIRTSQTTPPPVPNPNPNPNPNPGPGNGPNGPGNGPNGPGNGPNGPGNGSNGPGGRPQCSDGIDNDGDGKVDFPSDPGCSSPSDNSEVDTSQATVRGADCRSPGRTCSS